MNKQQKKGFKILLWVIAICFGTALIGSMLETPEVETKETIQPEEDEVVVDTPKVEEPVVVEEEPVVEEVIEEEPIVKEVVEPDKSDLEQAMLSFMQLNLHGIAEVTYSEEHRAYNILPTEEGFKTEIGLMASGLMDGNSWERLVDSQLDLSKTITSEVGPGYIINLINPANESNTILTLSDGVIFYDAFDGMY